MTDKEKLIKIKKLADAMYYGAFNMTTDASLLKKAMKEYRQFTIHEYCKEEPVSKDLEKASKSYGEEQYNKKLNLLPDKCRACYDPIVNAFKEGVKWHKEQLMNKAIDATIGYYNHCGLSIDVKLPKALKEDSKCKILIIKDE